jgi:hypothetical protein
MNKASIDQIKTKAQDLSNAGKKWHFHILTPECQLNETDKYALILENTSDGEVFVCYSDEPYMNIGKELVKLLHGDDVVKENTTEADNSKLSEQVTKILKRAKKLNAKGTSWHHHMLFPGCRYNKHHDKWVIIFEDKEAGEIIESITSEEPKSDLLHIETLFYQQKKAG